MPQRLQFWMGANLNAKDGELPGCKGRYKCQQRCGHSKGQQDEHTPEPEQTTQVSPCTNTLPPHATSNSAGASAQRVKGSDGLRMQHRTKRLQPFQGMGRRLSPDGHAGSADGEGIAHGGAHAIQHISARQRAEHSSQHRDRPKHQIRRLPADRKHIPARLRP